MSGISSMSLPDGRRGQVLAGALTVLALAILWLLIVSPLSGFYLRNRDKLETQRAMLSHMETVRATLPALERKLSRVGQSAQQETFFLPAASDATAGAELQQLIGALAHETGCETSALENMPAQTTGNLRKVGVRVNLSASWSNFVAFLTALEQSQPRLFADEFHIRSLQSNDVAQGEIVDVTLVARGFWLPAHDAGTSRKNGQSASAGIE